MKFSRRVKDGFTQNKWLVLFAVWGALIVGLHVKHVLGGIWIPSRVHPSSLQTTDGHIQTISKDRFRNEASNTSTKSNGAFSVHGPDEVIKPVIRTEMQVQQPNIAVSRYDVVLSSYMRSGSTLTGIILGWREDAFYLYEPLWKIARWTYWHGNNTVCRSDRPDCRIIAAEKGIQDRTFVDNKNAKDIGGSLVMAKNILRKLYDCQFNDFENQVLDANIAVKLGGPSWLQVKNCNDMAKVCMHRFAPIKCKNARHKVTKVLRLTVDNFEELLRTRMDIKVVHLFRDPRAIVNSRITTVWFPTKSDEQILGNAKSICKKMVKDYNEGLKLLQKYPDRFKFLYYEDLNDEPFEKVKILYKYLGMSLNPDKYPKVRSLPVFAADDQKSEREKNTAFWWRKSLKWSMIKKIDEVCSEAYALLGYRTFKMEKDLRNLANPSVDIPENFKLFHTE